MARFYGPVGFVETYEKKPGVNDYAVIERAYPGDVVKRHSQFLSQETVVDNIRVSNQISIVANPYAFENFQHIRFVVWNGVPWEVTSVSVEHPRLILTLGDVYNGPRAEETCLS